MDGDMLCGPMLCSARYAPGRCWDINVQLHLGSRIAELRTRQIGTSEIRGALLSQCPSQDLQFTPCSFIDHGCPINRVGNV
jgi:hypothetical protein